MFNFFNPKQDWEKALEALSILGETEQKKVEAGTALRQIASRYKTAQKNRRAADAKENAETAEFYRGLSEGLKAALYCMTGSRELENKYLKGV